MSDVALPTRELGALASDAMWSIVGQVDVPVIVDSFWSTGSDEKFLRAGLARAGARCVVEVWCEAHTDVVRSRFRTRARHFAHRDSDRGDEWEEFARTAGPISGYPVVRVDTGGPVDPVRLAAAIQAAFGGS